MLALLTVAFCLRRYCNSLVVSTACPLNSSSYLQPRRFHTHQPSIIAQRHPSQLSRASVGSPRPLRMVRLSRRLRRSPSRLDTRRNSSGTGTILAFDSHDCSPKKSAKSVARRTSMPELTHAIPLLPQRQSRFRPLLEMPRRIDRAARVPLRPNRPVLRERRCAED